MTDREKIIEHINKIEQYSRKPGNEWLLDELKHRFGSIDKIDKIYEYCIERVIKEQAEQFYKLFPIQEIIPKLVYDFCRMERYRREDDFEDYCLAVFQQVEGITNWFCQRPKFISMFNERMDDEIVLNNQGETTCIGKIIIQSDYDIRKNNPLMKLYFNERIRAVLYFIFFNGKYYKGTFDSTYSELNELYQCRNLNHRGGDSTSYQESIIERILPHRYLYYLKFNGLLVKYVEHISAFMSKKEETGVITSVLPSGAVYIKQESGEVLCFDKGKLWFKVKTLEKGNEVCIVKNMITSEILDIKIKSN